jgi:hypothetical protein
MSRKFFAAILLIFSSAPSAWGSPCGDLAKTFLKPFNTISPDHESQKILARCGQICIAEDEYSYYGYGNYEGKDFAGTFIKSKAVRENRGTFLQQTADGRRKELILGPLLESISLRAYKAGRLHSFFKPDYVELACETMPEGHIPDEAPRLIVKTAGPQGHEFWLHDLVMITKPGKFQGQVAAIGEIIRTDLETYINLFRNQEFRNRLTVKADEIIPVAEVPSNP